MSALNRTPTNMNFLQNEGFYYVIKKCPTVSFFTQNINVPGLSLPEAIQPTPLVHIPQSGDHISFEPLSITFKVDEDLKNYLEIFNWIQGQGYPDEHNQYKELADKGRYSGDGLVSDISLLITTNIKNVNYEIKYIDAFPVALSGFSLSTIESDVQLISATAQFKYTKFEINALRK